MYVYIYIYIMYVSIIDYEYTNTRIQTHNIMLIFANVVIQALQIKPLNINEVKTKLVPTQCSFIRYLSSSSLHV